MTLISNVIHLQINWNGKDNLLIDHFRVSDREKDNILDILFEKFHR